MCDIGNWEFNCPQFIDFAAGLDCPENDAWLGDPENKQKNALCKVLGPKMATPKVKPSQSLKNSPFVNTSRPVKTDDEKLAVLCKLPRRDSKSDGFLNRPIEHLISPCNIVNNMRKRSFSENCIRMKKKYPTTPMCLKRTYNNAKSKKGKTTEELELEKITELQNKLAQHLRLNEVNLKRLKKNKAPYPMQNVMNGKIKKEKQALKLELQEKVHSEQLNDLKRKNRKSRFQNENFVGMPGCNREDLNARTLKSRSEKLQNIINSACKTTASKSSALRVVNGGDKERKFVPRKWMPVKDNAHCGLKFLPNLDTTVPRPFSFDTSSVSSQNASFRLKDISKANFSTSLWTPNLLRDKENILHSSKFYSARNREGMNFVKKFKDCI